MICYAVIDTNILVSALLSSHDDTATVQIVRMLFTGEITPVFSFEILSEYRNVLSRKKFHFSQNLIQTLLDTIEKYGIFIETTPSDQILLDMKDLPFYEVALEWRNRGIYLVTGNLKHFPSKSFIVSARQMLDILNKE